jgi:hypothetical protein
VQKPQNPVRRDVFDLRLPLPACDILPFSRAKSKRQQVPPEKSLTAAEMTISQ